MNLDYFVKIANMKFNLKQGALKLGFEQVNNVYFVKRVNDNEDDKIMLTMDDSEIVMWVYRKQKITKQYLMITNYLDNEYNEEDFLRDLLKLFEEDGE